ncbi:MAG: hypothetical protein FGF53_04780 [Candidatus Brockarchaeota archaeon]|nr:hypothetical protein [Candidatus Brockarchaeota archaeon]MBO3808757.1 hypothetical protein [Candidatus Brockarchaeota archaeon]
MQDDQETRKNSVIRYTEFEKRIIEKSSNLYKGYYSPWEIYKLSAWSMGWIMMGGLLFLGACVWIPNLSIIMLLGSFLFLSIHYLLGVLITQFRARRRIMLFSALLALSLAWALWFLSAFFYAYDRPPSDIVTQTVYVALFMIWTMPLFARRAYVLVQAYRGKYDKELDQSTLQQ